MSHVLYEYVHISEYIKTSKVSTGSLGRMWRKIYSKIIFKSLKDIWMSYYLFLLFNAESCRSSLRQHSALNHSILYHIAEI